jgi:hypothetical protein
VYPADIFKTLRKGITFFQRVLVAYTPRNIYSARFKILLHAKYILDQTGVPKLEPSLRPHITVKATEKPCHHLRVGKIWCRLESVGSGQGPVRVFF